MEEDCAGVPAVVGPTQPSSSSAHSSAQEAVTVAAPGSQPAGGSSSSSSARSQALEPAAPGCQPARRPTEEIIVGVNAQLERGSASEHGSEGSAATQLHSLPESEEAAPGLELSASSDDKGAAALATSSSSEDGAASPGRAWRKGRGRRKAAMTAQALSSWAPGPAPEAAGGDREPAQGRGGGRRRKEERWKGLRVVPSSSQARRPLLPLQPAPRPLAVPEGGSSQGTALSLVPGGSAATLAVQRHTRVRAWVDLLVVWGVVAGLCVSLGVGLTSLLAA